MRYWLLCYRPEGVAGVTQGEAHELISEVSFGTSSDNTFDLRLQPDENPELFETAKLACGLGQKLLWRESHLRKPMTIRFNVRDLPRNMRGRSSGLVFSLAAICRGWNRATAFPAIAATGVLGADGSVQKVQGCAAKLRAAIGVIPPGGVIFYPGANHNEIDAKLLTDAAIHKVQLFAVDRLDQAVTHLGIPLYHAWLEAPFRGLEVFEYKHRTIYFGRGREIATVCQRLKERDQAGQAGILILGPSGAGKSSFLQAGIIPALIDGEPTRNFDWAVWRPQLAEPRTEAGLYQSILQNWMEVSALSGLKTESASGKLVDIIGHWVRDQVDGRSFVWVIDQLEELFTLGFSNDAICAFAVFIMHLQQSGVWVIATLRSDFYPQYAEHDALLKVFEDTGVFNLPLLKQEALRQVIECPATASDFSFEQIDGVSLVDRLLADIGNADDVLPLLEFTLTELYNKRDDTKHMLTFKAYAEIGGINGAIGKAAERAIGEHNQELLAELPALLRALVRVEENKGKRDTAKSINLENANFNEATRKLIDKLLSQRLLVRSNEGDSPQLRVAHEALFSHWPVAASILKASRQSMLIRDRLIQAAKVWEESGKDNSRLLVAGLPLAEGIDLIRGYGDELVSEPMLVEFIRTSIQYKEYRGHIEEVLNSTRRSLKKQTIEVRILFGVAFVLVIVLVNLGWESWELMRRSHQIEWRVAQSKLNQLRETIQPKLILEKRELTTVGERIKELERLIEAHEKNNVSYAEKQFIEAMRQNLVALRASKERLLKDITESEAFLEQSQKK